jgi:hypothetical protein
MTLACSVLYVLPAPAYVSARSADEILSSIRPTRIKSESLRSLNIFLDELLWLILHSARSLATNRLKAGLLQVMPGGVGKDAVLEAEVELRAYRQRSPSLGPDEQGAKQAEFPLQPTFEVRIHPINYFIATRLTLCTFSSFARNARPTARWATWRKMLLSNQPCRRRCLVQGPVRPRSNK